MNKLKAISRSVSFSSRSSNASKNNGHEKDKLEPTVGFKLTLHESDTTCGGGEQHTSSSRACARRSFSSLSFSVPELEVQLLGARHLPSSFGLKTVEGYMIKVK
jgi:hypothetical protein